MVLLTKKLIKGNDKKTQPLTVPARTKWLHTS